MNAGAGMSGSRDMSPWFEGMLAKYGAILLGVSIGTAAKYGLTLGEGRPVTWREVLSDMLLVPMICLIAAFGATKFGADVTTVAVIAAFLAVSSDRGIRLLRERFIQRMSAEVDVLTKKKGEIRQVSQMEISKRRVVDGEDVL